MQYISISLCLLHSLARFIFYLFFTSPTRMDKRAKFSRRRAVHTDSEIDYINERNMRFNKKAERFYGKHTQEIKDALERGTAV